jgi:hypothetical protein
MATITGIFGLQGSGKTMLMTNFGKRDCDNGLNIYSNYHLKGIPYTPISSLEDINKIKDGTFLCDECWLWMFSRTSMTKMNQELMKIVMLNRKRSVNIYYTAQLSRSVDVLLKEVTNYFVYPSIRPVKIVNKDTNKETGETDFRLFYYIVDLYGNMSPLIYLVKPLQYLGSFYDTTEEIDSLKRLEETPLQKGIQLEETFSKALQKIKSIKHVEVIPYSGSHSTWGFDVIAYFLGKTVAFDVKGSCRDRVYMNCFGRELLDKISNARSHNAVPYIAFPRNDRVQLTNPNYWYVHPLTNYSYLLKLSSNPAYKKFVEESKPLMEIDFCRSEELKTVV